MTKERTAIPGLQDFSPLNLKLTAAFYVVVVKRAAASGGN
jgi:hypothetical protein